MAFARLSTPNYSKETDMADTIDNTEANGTGPVAEGQNQSQEAVKTFTQDEVNEIIAKRIAQVNKKYADIDPDEYRQLKGLRERVEEQELMERKDFETLLKKTKEKADSEVTSLRSQLESIKLDGALINASSKLKSIAPEQTAKLLRDQLALDANGNAVVKDKDGQIRYNDNAEPMTVEQLVDEFLNSNTYFRAAGPSGTASESNSRITDNQKVDLKNLDMTRADHREIYKKMMRTGQA